MTDIEAAVWMRKTYCLEESRDKADLIVIRAATSPRVELTPAQAKRVARLLDDLVSDAEPKPVGWDNPNNVEE